MKQIVDKKWVIVIPGYNLIYVFVSLFLNMKNMGNKWQLKLFKYLILVAFCTIPLLWILEEMSILIGSTLTKLFVFYLFSVVSSFFLMLWQHECMKK